MKNLSVLKALKLTAMANLVAVVSFYVATQPSQLVKSTWKPGTKTVLEADTSARPPFSSETANQYHSDNKITAPSAADEAYQQYLEDTQNPFSINFTGTHTFDSEHFSTVDYETACQLANDLGIVEREVWEDSGDIQRCEKTILRHGLNDRIQVEVMAYKGEPENIAATIWLQTGMTARDAILSYEGLLQYLAFQFSSDTLDNTIYRIEEKSQIHFRSANGGFVGALSFSYAHLQFSYSK